ncbi:NADP oxidoreductase [Actinomadura logoneensis]|uniref:NADP oxidoreductase n=1 Tax=Actinomadura logoneensis TaxID=2293572 RepID=A0A372JJ25_9ACTN|nr:NAD(P)-binding domain-containing protein [Actinomadura logoneensis]RFU40022.1 NADP oxidoreductase [Actinomadura logoneensis]
MRIGIIGTGHMARTLGARWVRAGHEVAIAGRSAEKARALADEIGAEAVAPEAIAAGRDAVLVAVSWDAAESMVAQADVPSGTVLIDATNAVEHGIGRLVIAPGESMAGRIANAAPGAHVVKAFHTFPFTQWALPSDSPAPSAPTTGDTSSADSADASQEREPVVVMCGDDPGALKTVGELARDLGGVPVALGGLDRARQLEEVAGFVIGMAFAGHDPSAAVPRI